MIQKNTNFKSKKARTNILKEGERNITTGQIIQHKARKIWKKKGRGRALQNVINVPVRDDNTQILKKL